MLPIDVKFVLSLQDRMQFEYVGNKADENILTETRGCNKRTGLEGTTQGVALYIFSISMSN
jgi:hypothetical protein